jgi:CheY-like chemotaxis protein
VKNPGSPPPQATAWDRPSPAVNPLKFETFLAGPTFAKVSAVMGFDDSASALLEFPNAPQGGIARRRGYILVVDDEPLIGASARRLLSPEHDVVVVHSGEAALAAVESPRAFDAVLCDLMMPGMTGIELHRELDRSRPELAERMVFITGGAFTEAAEDFLDRVATRRMDKPFEPRALQALVRELVGD